MLLARSYSHYSLLSALPKIPELVKRVKEMSYTTLALTDEDSGAGFIEFYETCLAEGIKPCIGVTLRTEKVLPDKSDYVEENKLTKIVFLAKNKAGYYNLLKLISTARTINETPRYHLKLTEIQTELEKDQGFFVLIPGNDHEILQNLVKNKFEEAETILKKYAELFGAKNVLVELAVKLNNQTEEEVKNLNLKLAEICQKLNLKYIASPASRYFDKTQEEAFRVVLAIRNQTKLDKISLTRDFSLPTKNQLSQTYAYLPESLETEEIENQIDIKIRTDFDKNAQEAYFPKFQLPADQNPRDRLRWESYIGLFERFHPDRKTLEEWKQIYPYENLNKLVNDALEINPDTSKLLGYPQDYWDRGIPSNPLEGGGNNPSTSENLNSPLSGQDKSLSLKFKTSASTGYQFSQDPEQITIKEKKTIRDYIDRLEHELDIIITKGYPEYFLVFGDIMRFCRENDIITNTRGSAAGSIIGYLNQIVVLDPLVYNLPFERFLNPFRPSPPDIDGDFADDRREEVINYIKEKYGKDSVSQIITFGTMLPKAAVRDVGRVLGVPYSKCDKLSKLIPNAPQGRKTTFEYAFETSPEVQQVYDRDPESKRIIDISKLIEGNFRHASSHAAGVIITPGKLEEFAPIQWDSEHQSLVIQYDMKVAEKAGLIKLDILGITNLAILGNSIKIAKRRHKVELDLFNINMFEERAFQLLARGRTMGTFQLSGEAMTNYLMELEPNKVEDLMAMVALYRPGPMGIIPDYIKRKKDPSKIKYIVPQMEGWMKESLGLLVYQDDLLYTAIYLAGYNWGEADVLRKGMGKKIQAVIEKEHPKFVDGCVKHSGLDKETAEYIWSLIVPFGAYGFNKAHSASYGIVAYWTAYMKSLYTVDFMTAYMTSESNNLDKIASAIRECEAMGITVKPPDINYSRGDFFIEDDKTIRYGLETVKNLGKDVVRFMIKERDASGKFTSLEDFVMRMGGCKTFNKRSLEALIWAGALDELGHKAAVEAGVV